MSSAVGLYGLGEMNEAGEHLEGFCLEHEMTQYHVQTTSKAAAYFSPDGNTQNQTD